MKAIENNYLRVEVHPEGAELRSLYDKKKDRELLWQRDTTFWGKSSPILFPFVGETKGGGYRYANSTYRMPKHGFARDLEFELVVHTPQQISFLLRSNEATLEIYPFVFELYLHYKLDDNRISFIYEVRNLGDSDIFFSIGGHPAFQLDLRSGYNLSDYYLEFPDDHMLKRYFIKDGLLQVQPEWHFLEGIRLYLRNGMFQDDAWILKDLRSTEVQLRNRQGNYSVKLDFREFPYLGMWAPAGAPFVCLEPWCGVNDLETHTGELEKKEGVIRLEALSNCRRTWVLTICEL